MCLLQVSMLAHIIHYSLEGYLDNLLTQTSAAQLLYVIYIYPFIIIGIVPCNLHS